MTAPRIVSVLRAGLCDLVMDRGRYGYTHLGVPIGGAADALALRWANRLVGNIEGAAGLEITLKGPLLAFPQGGAVALTGAPFVASRSSGNAVEWNETLVMSPDEQLDIGVARSGCRGWLAVQGGIEVPEVMRSRSTFLPAGFGGLDGRALAAGDQIALGEVSVAPRILRIQPPFVDETTALHVVPGPQAALFTEAGLAAFFNSPYRVQGASDRRGVRLHGAPVAVTTQDGIATQAVLPGAIQIPPDGQPIILGWDGPVTGGYPVIAGLISADLARLAQLKPGDVVRFATMSVEAARTLARNRDVEVMDGY
mgnify:CR=1 FL=1